VDGKDLGFHKCCKAKHSKTLVGLRSAKEGVSTHTALRFETPKITIAHNSNSNSNSNSNANTIMENQPGLGTVKVSIYERTFVRDLKKKKKKRKCDNAIAVSMQVESIAISSSLTHGHKKKMLRSGGGSHTLSRESSNSQNRYKRGTLLETITIHYSTAMGLVHAGVFGKPEDEEEGVPSPNHQKLEMDTTVVVDSKPSHASDRDIKPRAKPVKTEGATKVEAKANSLVVDLTGDSDED
jgi:hypothetical protein